MSPPQLLGWPWAVFQPDLDLRAPCCPAGSVSGRGLEGQGCGTTCRHEGPPEGVRTTLPSSGQLVLQ